MEVWQQEGGRGLGGKHSHFLGNAVHHTRPSDCVLLSRDFFLCLWLLLAVFSHVYKQHLSYLPHVCQCGWLIPTYDSEPDLCLVSRRTCGHVCCHTVFTLYCDGSSAYSKANCGGTSEWELIIGFGWASLIKHPFMFFSKRSCFFWFSLTFNIFSQHFHTYSLSPFTHNQPINECGLYICPVLFLGTFQSRGRRLWALYNPCALAQKVKGSLCQVEPQHKHVQGLVPPTSSFKNHPLFPWSPSL